MRKILTLVIMIACAVGLKAQTAEQLYIYQSGGVTDTLRMGDVRNISHSRFDASGTRHHDFVTMLVTLNDDAVRQYLLSSLDSVVLQRGSERIHLTVFHAIANGNGNVNGNLRRTSLNGDFTVSTADVDFFWEQGDNIYVDLGAEQLRADSVHITDSKAFADF
ncbi:MAG: hypothetical protein J6Z41_09065, partial [Prevotella sp.]|nr:hypothetical protein [Prevotella sp.]